MSLRKKRGSGETTGFGARNIALMFWKKQIFWFKWDFFFRVVGQKINLNIPWIADTSKKVFATSKASHFFSSMTVNSTVCGMMMMSARCKGLQHKLRTMAEVNKFLSLC
jgi:hypothetical protein